jgi:hypothetical protein
MHNESESLATHSKGAWRIPVGQGVSTAGVNSTMHMKRVRNEINVKKS